MSVTSLVSLGELVKNQAVGILLLIKHTGNHWLLIADEVVHFFEFLTHPTSFSQTVENIFHFSFLIKVGF